MRHPGVHAPKPVTVPIQVHFDQGQIIGSVPLVEVRVGNGPAVPVILDTGSTGLHIFQTGCASDPAAASR